MASNTNVRGEYVGGNRWAMVEVHEDGEEWYEEWREQDCLTGQWQRDNTVSNPLSYMFQRGMTPEFAASLPRYNEKDVPTDFWLPQGEITAQMYQIMSQEFAHSALAITRRTNYWKARKFAYNIHAWYILDGVKGVLAKFPGMDKPNFYSWEEFAGAMNTYFPTKTQETDEPAEDTSTNDFYFYSENGNRLTPKE
jgi:hypothetical protein